MVKTRIQSGLAAVGFGLAMMVGGASGAFAGGATSSTGDVNLRSEGYVLLTPSGGSLAKDDVEGIGQLTVTSAGVISGAETYTAVDSAAGTEDLCAGTVGGSITSPSGSFASGTGYFTVSLDFTPTSGGSDCIASSASLSCSRELYHTALVDNLSDGTYRCVVTNVSATSGTTTVNGASMRVQLTPSRGTNSPES